MTARARNAPRGRPTLTTERLVLRPLTWDDLPELEALDADPEVTRFLGPAGTPAQARERMLTRFDPGNDAMGLGYWAGLERGRFVGWWLLAPVGPGLAEIGWRLHVRAWGRGLATEGALALLRHGFGPVRLERVVAESSLENLPSQGVMRRLGMRPAGVLDGVWTGELTRAQWRAARSAAE